MNGSNTGYKIKTREELYSFLQNQMSYAYSEIREEKKLSYESTLVKSYLFEVDLPVEVKEASRRRLAIKGFLEKNFRSNKKPEIPIKVLEKEEDGFFEIQTPEVTFYLDTITNERFWIGFSVSGSSKLDNWFETIVLNRCALDFLWLWPEFLEDVQSRGEPRGFGLDYDFRKFEESDSDVTTYLKMQLWGGPDTHEVYKLLKQSGIKNKTVLSKIRMKSFGDIDSRNEFAIQEVKYTGKFTTKGTDFSVHAATLNYVRAKYEKKITAIEKNYGLRWVEKGTGNVSLEGHAIHFIPVGFEIPVVKFCEKVFDGTNPFRMLGLTTKVSEYAAITDAVDLHTGGELSFEVYPDILTIYLPHKTCGNSIARLFTNLQHYFNVGFIVEADDGERIF